MAAVARAQSLVRFPASQTFDVYPGAASDQAHMIAAASALDAAIRFLEGWHPSVDSAGAVDLSVVDRASGDTTRFDIDLD